MEKQNWEIWLVYDYIFISVLLFKWKSKYTEIWANLTGSKHGYMGISIILHFKRQLRKFQKFYYLQDELFYKQ